MARRVTLLTNSPLPDDIARVRVPTLIVTGEASLDRIIPVAATREYARMWPHARVAEIPRTGHLGLITRPEAFARLVVPFAEHAWHDAGERRLVG